MIILFIFQMLQKNERSQQEQNMLLKQKKKLAQKLSKIHLRIQSQAFAKIFLIQQKSFKKIGKIRHYDIQMEAVSAIASWLKKKCQVQYLKGFYQIKSYTREKLSFKGFKQKQFRRSPKVGFVSKTDRINIKRQNQKLDTRTQYKNSKTSASYKQSMTDRNDQIKSNLEFLLNKVKKVNNQSKFNSFQGKQNQYIQNYSTIRIDQDEDISQINQKSLQIKQRIQNYCKTQQSKLRNIPKNSKRQQIINKIQQLQSTLTTMKEDLYNPDLSRQNDSIYCPKYSVYSEHGNPKYYQLRKYSRN